MREIQNKKSKVNCQKYHRENAIFNGYQENVS